MQPILRPFTPTYGDFHPTPTYEICYQHLALYERKGWGVQVKEEHEVAIENWWKEMQADPSEEPVACQKYVQSLYFYVS